MSANWYDVLGVASDATAEEISAAWRASTDKFGPGTGQFKLFNEAADVLLDPTKRSAYDAELGAEAPTVAAPAEEPPVEEPAVQEPAPIQASAEPRTGVLGAVTSTLGLAILAVLTVASLVLVVVLAGNLQHRADVARGGQEASSVAERAATAVLGYDYQTMTADRDRAVRFMTPKYKKIYDKLFNQLMTGAAPTEDGTSSGGGVEETKAVVTAQVISTGVVDADRNEVRVLLFVNQQPILNGVKKDLLSNRVVATMVKRHGDWLLDYLDPLGAGF
jgi:Mce-associated membrane protein